ncbi:MAG: outer membrane beta-barrel protein [Hyphomicrobiaceae bacterium]
MSIISGCRSMGRIIALSLGLVAVSAVSSATSAQEIYPRNWTGVYLGFGVGAGAINHQLDVQIPAIPAGVTFDGIGGEGIFGTIQIGADLQLNRSFVVGLFLDYDYSGIKTDASFVAPGVVATGEIPVDDMWTIGARLGYLTSPSTLWYVGAGYSQMRMGAATGSISFGGPPLVGSFPLPDFQGYSLLAGVESQLWNNFSIKLEYRFTQFERESVFNIPQVVDIGLEPSIHAARVVASYRFNLGDRYVEPLK